MIEAKYLSTGWMRMAAPVALVAAGLLAHVPAQASAFTLPMAMTSIAITQDACRQSAMFAPAAPAVPDVTTAASKSTAILGGTMSALDRIRMQQAGLAMPEPAPVITPEPVAEIQLPDEQCNSFRLAMPVAPAIPEAAVDAPSKDNFLASSRIGIRHTQFTRQWDRVSHAQLQAERVEGIVGDSEAAGATRLQFVNRWVNHAITYGEDREIWGARDYWASAAETLELGRGDCEDLAILKYQMLLSLGIAPEDMFLTLARDLARNADHAILIVREGGRFYMLDNSTDAILPANLSYDYRPTLSFNSQSAWLHGALSKPQPTLAMEEPTYLSVNAISSPRVIGFSR